MRLHMLTRTAAIALIAGLTPLGIDTAFAQASASEVAKAPDTYFVTVRDGVEMRCRPGAIWYPVARLERGQVLRKTGEQEGWLSVEYPPGTPALARVDRVEIRDGADGGQVAVLTRKTSLYAFNIEKQNSNDSYAMLFAHNHLEAGTRLLMINEVERLGGGLGGFLVMPPRGASGWVQPLSTDVRLATEDEVKAFLEDSGWDQQGEGSADNGAPEVAPPQDAGDQNNTTSDDQDSTDETGDTSDDDTASDVDEASPFDKATEGLESLNDAFRRLIQSPLEEAEVTPLIEAYEGFKGSLAEDLRRQGFGDAADAYIGLLKVRERLQQIMRETKELEARVGEMPDTAVVERSVSLGYTAVGRLMPSVIYNGERLPLLYRIVSVDTAVGRTIAYVAPSDEISMASRLGSIVGVRGSATTDQGRRVPILRVDEMDVLRSAE